MTCKEKILSENVYDFITDYPLGELNLGLGAPGEVNPQGNLCYVNVEGRFNIVYGDRRGPVGTEPDFLESGNVPKLYGLMQEAGGGEAVPDINNPFDPINLIASGITQVQRPPLSLTGRGTVVCIIDTGIDYRNPAFLDENGNTRILAIWDQTLQTGTSPEGFFYGSEYSKEEINRALRSEDPYSVVPTRDEYRHGSAMAGVAAGSNVRVGRQYLGAAPEADFVVVKLKECKEYLRRRYLVPRDVPAYQENDIMLGIKYGDSFARVFLRPVIFCIGLGTNLGDHTGGGPLSEYLDLIALKRSRAVVVAGGNEGNEEHHYFGSFSIEEAIEENAASMLRQEVEVRVGEGSLGFWLEFWGTLPDLFTVGVRTPGGETVPPVDLNAAQSITYGFVYTGSRVTVEAALAEAATGQQRIIFRVQDPTPGIWTFQVQAYAPVERGSFHLWLPITPFLNTRVFFLRPTPDITLTEPAYSREVLSVSAYNGQNGGFAVTSGRGFATDGSIRPDLAAPGVDVPTIYGSASGGSMAAAITAGAVAQFMQWAVVENNANFANGRQIKSYLIRGARRSRDLSYPNREWGYGRLDLEGTFRVLAQV